MKISVLIFFFLISPVSVICRRNNYTFSYFCGNGEHKTRYLSPIAVNVLPDGVSYEVNDVEWLHLPGRIVQKKVFYVLGLGFGFPVLVLFILCIFPRFIHFFSGDDDNQRLIDSDAAGLHQSIIKSYSTILLNKDLLLPNPHDTICSICISEYRPTEIVKTISVCNHYFHAQCIDEWLSMNVTCPVCRMCLNHQS